jgi:hypothetical protein
MSRKAALLAGILLAFSPASVLARTPAPAVAVAVESEAAASVLRSAALLRNLPAFALDAEMTILAFDENDHAVRESHELHYEYRAPNGLFIDWRSSGERRQLYFNGQTLSFFLPGSSAYVTLPDQGTASEMLIDAAEDFGVIMPLPDLFLWVIGAADPDAIQSARLVGRERIDGVETDHIALSQEGIDWEVWIDRGDRPLPRRILITAGDDPDRPQFAASLRWDVAPRIAAGRFTFTPPAGARRIRDEDDPLARDVALAGPRDRVTTGSG